MNDMNKENDLWPGPIDQIFDSDESAFSLPEIFRRDPSLCEYDLWKGYAEAGEILALQMQRRGSVSTRAVQYPMLFCYRHALELAIKSMMLAFEEYLEEKVGFELAGTHDLLKLWRRFRELADQAYPYHPDSKLTDDAVEKSIQDLHAVDHNGQIFRFAKNKKGQTTLTTIPYVRINGLIETMRSLNKYFDGCHAYLDNLEQGKADILDWYRE